MATTLAVGTVTFLLAYDGGTFGETSRGTLAIGVWWVVILAAGFGLWPLVRFTRAALVTGGLLAAFAALNLASTIWADSAEDAFVEFNRVTLYLGVLVFAVLAARRALLARWSDGFALGIVATAGLAFFTRCFPDVILTEENLAGLPLDFTRLSYPLEYWNGVAIFTALSVPLLLRAAVSEAPVVFRAVALLPFPVLAAVVYLTSSRGGYLTAVAGVLALLVLAPRARTVQAILVAAVGAAAGVACVATRDQLVNQPGPAAAGEGHTAFALAVVACAATAAAAFLLFRFASPEIERRTARVGPLGRALAAAGVVLLLAAGVAAAHPVRLFEKFKAPPNYELNTLPNTENPIRVHLLSAGSSGRWQQWGAVLEEFETAPVLGRGPGSYEAWWAEHGTLRGFVRDAHSLYLETLGELGIVGFLLIVGALMSGLVFGVRRAVTAAGDARVTVGALCAGFFAYAFAAGIDWMWEMTVVSVVGIGVLGLLTARASAAPGEVALRRRWQIAARAGLAVLGLAVIAAQAVQLLTDRELQASQAAVGRGDIAAAVEHAGNARNIEPWASRPYMQLALVAERSGDYDQAVKWIQKAIDRDPRNWRPWLLAARFQTERADVQAARRSLRRFCTLNPRSDTAAVLCPKGGG